jgi:hypothetical protein
LVTYCLGPYRRDFRGVGLGREAWPCPSPPTGGFVPGRAYEGLKKRGVGVGTLGVSCGVGTYVNVLIDHASVVAVVVVV